MMWVKEKRLLRGASLVLLSTSFQVSNLQRLLITHQSVPIFPYFMHLLMKITLTRGGFLFSTKWACLICDINNKT